MQKTKSPRLHKNLVAAVVEALETAFGQNIYADKALERLLKSNAKWGARDRAFVAENTYHIVRNWRKLWHIYGSDPNLSNEDLYALFGVHYLLQGGALPDWPAFAKIKQTNWREKEAALPPDLAIQESYPEWLHHLAEAELGKTWDEYARELNREAKLILRCNTLKTNRKELKNAFAESKATPTLLAEFPDAIALSDKINVFRMEAFSKGWFEVQDAGSQSIAPFMQVEPGMRIIDACAGAGGKSLHLAALMHNQGHIVAMDISEYKLKELKKRARRNGVSTIETRLIGSTKVIKRLHQSANRVLLDVPCSGLGVLKRNPDTKWKLQPEFLDRVRNMQRDLLHRYAPMAKPGGKLVYATCSILPSENEAQVEYFLKQHPEFSLEAEERLKPTLFNDGFYMARLKRAEG